MEPIHVHIPYPKLKEYLDMLRKRRYDLEIYLSAAVLDQIEKQDLEKLLELLDWQPKLTLHAPFMDMNPGAMDPMVRSVTQVRFRQLLNVAAILKPRVAVENVFDEDPEALQMLIEKIDSPDFGFCFDTGHFNLFSTVAMEKWFESLGRRLLEVHLHDNDGKADSHWALGRGNVDFEKFFGMMNTTGSAPVFTIEAHDKDDIETSLERVRHLMKKDRETL